MVKQGEAALGYKGWYNSQTVSKAHIYSPTGFEQQQL